MLVSAIQCRDCLSIIFSRARHDFRWCKCKHVAIDGGRDYTKISGDIDNILSLAIDINATPKELFDDWNQRRDRWGLHDCIEAATGYIHSGKPLVRRARGKKKAVKRV